MPDSTGRYVVADLDRGAFAFDESEAVVVWHDLAGAERAAGELQTSEAHDPPYYRWAVYELVPVTSTEEHPAMPDLTLADGAPLDVVVQAICPACECECRLTYENVTGDVPALGSVVKRGRLPVCSCPTVDAPEAEFRVTAYRSGWAEPEEDSPPDDEDLFPDDPEGL